MSELETIKELARAVFTGGVRQEGAKEWLWDRAERLVRNVEYISQLPELGGVQIDRFCLYAAAYFSEAGLASYSSNENERDKRVFGNGNRDKWLDLSTEIVGQKLSDVIDKARIEKINRIITESGNNLTKMTEAMILSDAHNLDDMGAVGIFNELRQLVSAGKGAGYSIENWQKKVDYRYWEVRLQESFRFEQVRRIAERRLATAEYFMGQLKSEAQGEDLEKSIIELQEIKK